MKILALFVLFIPFVFADTGEKKLAGFDPVTDVISEEYMAGPYLMYDCKEGHWVCVLESYYQECQEKRGRELASSSETHSCAPIGVFPTKKSCFQRQLYMTSHNYGKRFCMKDSWKQKNLD